MDVLNIRRQWRDPELLQKFQDEKLAAVLQAASQTSYYKQRVDFPADSIYDFPITEKSDVKKDPCSFIRDGLDKGKLTEYRTSGSTGEPVKIFVDKETIMFRKCLYHAISFELGRSPFDVTALIQSQGDYKKPEFSSNFGLFRNIFIHANEDVDKILSIMRSNRVNRLSGYASEVYLLAKANLKNPIKIDMALTGSEILTDDHRKTIEESFSCNVFDKYACWEFGNIAWECPEEHSLHVNSNSVLLEIVDSKGKPKKNGVGEILVTSLHNRAMPLIRYMIGDLAAWGKECSCGRALPVLKSIEGRCDDLITLPSGKKITPMAVMAEYRGDIYKGISVYQLIQERPDLIVVKIVPSKEGFGYEKEFIERIKEGCLGEDVTVEIEIVDKIQRKGGKLRRVISKVR